VQRRATVVAAIVLSVGYAVPVGDATSRVDVLVLARESMGHARSFRISQSHVCHAHERLRDM
jgi:hypothetical protein